MIYQIIQDMEWQQKANGFQGRAFTHFVVELSDGPVWEVQQIATKKKTLHWILKANHDR